MTDFTASRPALPLARAVQFSEWTLLLTVTAFAVWLRALLPMNADTSWLITASEMLLDGRTLYTEIGETNPPASIWMYAPLVALARALSLRPELVVTGALFGLLFISMRVSWAILARCDWADRYDPKILSCAAVVIFGILPGDTFTEREHVAAILSLPFLAATFARMEGRWMGWPLAMAAGLCGGCVAIIKPHFVLALELPVLLALFNRPGWRMVFSTENLIAGLLTMAYVASTFVYYPQFWRDAMAVNAVVYLPSAEPWRAMTSIVPPFLLALAFSVSMYRGQPFRREPSALCMAAAAGFCIAYIVQGKNWAYHVYPVIALGTFGAILAVLVRRALRRPEPSSLPERVFLMLCHPAVIVCGALLIFGSLFFQHHDRDRLAAAISRIKPRPVIASISGDIALGHPVARMVAGQWATTQPALWVVNNGLGLRRKRDADPAMINRIEAVEDADLSVFLNDLRRNRPDILLGFRNETALRARLERFPGMVEELAKYELADSVALTGDAFIVEILRRRPEASSTQR